MTRLSIASLLAVSLACAGTAHAQGVAKGRRQPIDPAGIQRLSADSGGGADVTVHEATGAARFVKKNPGGRLGRQVAAAATDQAKVSRSSAFLQEYGTIFGITNASTELQTVRVDKDAQGGTHLTHRQSYFGLPVFGGELKSHFDAAGDLVAVNGTFVPQLTLDPNPGRTATAAADAAVAKVQADLAVSTPLAAAGTTLLVYREGLAQGVDGPNHLAWQVEVGNGVDVREFVYIDAHSGKFIDQISGLRDGLNRRAFNANGATAPGANYPNSPFWVEGQSLPTGTVEADNMILASKETYDLYSKAFGRDSFDGAGATMDSIFNRGNGCPNASWNGTFISFCPGLTTDDVTGHEWTHAYTEYTHDLIYAWQPGALNEAYSDIFGETIDRINGRGGDTPDIARGANSCSIYTPLAPKVQINAPSAIAGLKSSGTAAFGPQQFVLTGDIVVASPSIACSAPTNSAALAGKIALVDRGTCGFAVKVKVAQDAGAIGVIVANNAAGLINMAGVDPTITIPALSILLADGNAIKTQVAAGATVNATLNRSVGTDNSVRWLLGEDSKAPGLSSALRDMWNPTCLGNPGKVSDTAQYVCSTTDSGGVHTNSGVPNHGYALVVDGGSYNGQTITGLGLTKAAHIYFRAMNVYQGPASDFADHADALEQSCSDLVGVNLTDLATGTPSGQAITASDCAQVAKAILAVELRTPPVQCNFQPLLAQNPPALCEAGGFATPLFKDTFDAGNSSNARWSVSHEAVVPADFTPRDWQLVSSLPDKREGSGFFAANPNIGSCAAGGDESGVLHLDSPSITIPASVSAPRLTFDHWVATESGFDGGNLKISVNGGPWVLVQPADFVYNPYNAQLATAAQGNTNPLAGQRAFTGSDGGSVSGSWGRSIVNLAPYAQPKDKIRLRFDLGNDGCGGSFGWYLDDLSVYQCHAN